MRNLYDLIGVCPPMAVALVRANVVPRTAEEVAA